MEKESLNLLIGGEAGEGLVTMGQILAKSLVRKGYSILVTQDYQSRIRGGHNTFGIRAGIEKISAPKESIDLLIALNEETVWLHKEELSHAGRVIVDSAYCIGDITCVEVPFSELGDKRYLNTAALGVVGSLLGIDEMLVAATLKDYLGKKDTQVVETNLGVLGKAYRWGLDQSPLVSMKLTPVSKPEKRLMMNGNEAIALGALSAGVKCCAFYPMTPATSIVMNLIAHAKETGIVVEQAEDEIAAVNIAIGASFAGASSMVATSGGGFALMTEGVSLAAMTETPIVMVIAQRPGPATGLPTRTEQGDLEFVLHSGHGEFPRAIFTPGSIEDCFYLTRRAFELSERYQGPVFLLTDQFLADSYRAVDPFDIKNLPQFGPSDITTVSDTPYNRYQITESGISPRLLPGLTQHLVVADSDEHTGDGHITENLSVRKQMVEKRLRKGRGILEEVIPPERSGDVRPDLLIISWGSSLGAVEEAASMLRGEGRSVSILHFSQVWPLKPSQFLNTLHEARDVICVEGNATGQFSRLIGRETGFQIPRRVLRYDGLPLTPEYINLQIKKIETGGE
jgi:2-oxoglutarate ferredoxin oxidoreductase subunit alpha